MNSSRFLQKKLFLLFIKKPLVIKVNNFICSKGNLIIFTHKSLQTTDKKQCFIKFFSFFIELLHRLLIGLSNFKRNLLLIVLGLEFFIQNVNGLNIFCDFFLDSAYLMDKTRNFTSESMLIYSFTLIAIFNTP